MATPLYRPYFNQQELEEISKVLESGWVSKGPESEAFEKIVSSYVGAASGIAVVNCTAALHLALLSLGIKKGDEVLVSDFTFPATAHAVLYCGAKPRFVDVRMDTYNIDVLKIDEQITERTKAIIPVHAFGQSADMNPILKIARRFGLAVVEDAACSLGGTYRGRMTGSIGDLGCFSFHARKGVTTGEGGMVVTSSSDLEKKVRYLSVFGMKTAWEREESNEYQIPKFHDVGYNYKLSDILAAVGVVQMGKIEGILKKKAELAKYYDERLNEVRWLSKPTVAKFARHAYQSYVVVVEKGVNRNKLIYKLKEQGVQAQIGTYSCHVQPVYRSKQVCPVSRLLSDSTLALPFYPSMTEGEIDKVIRALVNVKEDAA